MFDLLATIPRVLFSGFQSRRQLILENLALRHQLTVLRRSVPRAKLQSGDRFLWALLLRLPTHNGRRLNDDQHPLPPGPAPQQ